MLTSFQESMTGIRAPCGDEHPSSEIIHPNYDNLTPDQEGVQCAYKHTYTLAIIMYLMVNYRYLCYVMYYRRGSVHSTKCLPISAFETVCNRRDDTSRSIGLTYRMDLGIIHRSLISTRE